MLLLFVAGTGSRHRTWVAFDGYCACGDVPVMANAPDGARWAELPAAAVSAVTVLPSHRRRGDLTGMAAMEHAALVERGECVGLLYVSEYPIYGRFGYVPGTRTADWVITTRATAMRGTRPAPSSWRHRMRRRGRSSKMCSRRGDPARPARSAVVTSPD